MTNNENLNILVVRFPGRSTEYEYLWDQPIDLKRDLKKHPLLLVVNTEGGIKSIPDCTSADGYKVLPVVEIRKIEEQRFLGELKYGVALIDPANYRARYARQLKLARLEKQLDAAAKKASRLQMLQQLAVGNPELGRMLVEYQTLLADPSLLTQELQPKGEDGEEEEMLENFPSRALSKQDTEFEEE